MSSLCQCTSLQVQFKIESPENWESPTERSVLKNKCSNMKLSCLNEDAKQLLRARRMATRNRAAAACKPCKSRKTKCSDYRPCAQCKTSKPLLCVESIEDKSGEPIPVKNTVNRCLNQMPHKMFVGVRSRIVYVVRKPTCRAFSLLRFRHLPKSPLKIRNRDTEPKLLVR